MVVDLGEGGGEDNWFEVSFCFSSIFIQTGLREQCGVVTRQGLREGHASRGFWTGQAAETAGLALRARSSGAYASSGRVG